MRPCCLQPARQGRARPWVLAGLLCAAAGLAGCASKPRTLYHWDGFQPQLYQHFKGDRGDAERQLRILGEQAQKAQAVQQALPPGFHGHLALLYLQTGRFDEARTQLELEKARFPESAPYMDFLLRNLKGPAAPAAPAAASPPPAPANPVPRPVQP